MSQKNSENFAPDYLGFITSLVYKTALVWAGELKAFYLWKTLHGPLARDGGNLILIDIVADIICNNSLALHEIHKSVNDLREGQGFEGIPFENLSQEDKSVYEILVKSVVLARTLSIPSHAITDGEYHRDSEFHGYDEQVKESEEAILAGLPEPSKETAPDTWNADLSILVNDSENLAVTDSVVEPNQTTSPENLSSEMYSPADESNIQEQNVSNE